MGYKDKDTQREYQREWYQTNKERLSKKQRHTRKVRRLQLLEMYNNECAKCGCSIVKILELNHKAGKGREDTRKNGRQKVWREIIEGKRPKEDYEILCKVCNAIHNCEVLLGLGKWEVKFIR